MPPVFLGKLCPVLKNSRQVESSTVGLKVRALDGETPIDLPVVFSVSKLPVSKDDIPRQTDVDRWSHLQGVVLSHSDTEVGLLIGNDVPQALQPKEVRGGDLGNTNCSWLDSEWSIRSRRFAK